MPKPLTVEYERTKDLGNFQTERVKIVAEVLEGETAQKVLNSCKAFVAANLESGMDADMDRANNILANELDCTMRDVLWAKKYVADHENQKPAGDIM